MSALRPGLTAEHRTVVTEQNTAAAMGAGGVKVFGTPAMINLMEMACWLAVQPHMPDDHTSVGTVVDIRHLAATPIGMAVTAIASLIEVDGRRLVFHVEAHDEIEKVGEGRHERFIVPLGRFLQRIGNKGKAPDQ